MGSHDGEVSSTNHSLVVSSIEQDQRVSLLDLYSDELEDDFEDASPTNMPLCSSKLNTPSSESLIAKFKWKQEWEFRYQPKLEPLLLFQNDLKRFENLHACGVTSMELLTSMAYVVSQRDTIDTIHVHTQKLKRVARHLSVGRTPRDLKLMTLKTLVECLSPLTASWQFCDSVIDGTLDFLILGHQEWEFMDHTHFTLLQQIRFLSLQYKAREKERVALVEKTGDRASLCISAGAKLVEAGMQNSLPIIEKHLDTCAKKIKDLLKSGEYPLMVDRDAVVCMTFSDGAKRLSERAKISTTCAVSSIRDISALGLDLLVQKIKPLTSTQEQNLPPECIEAIRACGKVGMAAIGAAAIVGEAIIETSRALVQKTGAATADVVEYKYGTTAGQVVSDASETCDNLIRAVGNVAMLEKTIVVKSVAKTAGKTQVDLEVQRTKDSLHLLEIQAAGMIHQVLTGGRFEWNSKMMLSPRGALETISGKNDKENLIRSQDQQRIHAECVH